MGKRELLLAVAFVLVGLVVYQFTAPPPDPNATRLFAVPDHRRDPPRGSRPTRVRRGHPDDSPGPVAESSRRSGSAWRSARSPITGEDRDDIEAEFHVRSNGYDKAEAEKLARESTLKFDEAGGVLIIATDFPAGGTQRRTLRLKVPGAARRSHRRQERRTDDHQRRAGRDGDLARRDHDHARRRAPSALTQRGSTATITDVGSLKLTSAAGAKVARRPGPR